MTTMEISKRLNALALIYMNAPDEHVGGRMIGPALRSFANAAGWPVPLAWAALKVEIHDIERRKSWWAR